MVYMHIYIYSTQLQRLHALAKYTYGYYGSKPTYPNLQKERPFASY